MTEPTKVLYITGWLRSGSTVLGNVLNELPGVLHVGELHYLWRNGLLRAGTNSSCGCGSEVRSCELWSSVLDQVRPGDLGPVAERMAGWQRRYLRTRNTVSRLAESRRRRQPARLTEGLDLMADIYRAVAGRGAEKLVVDSSKYPAELAALLGRDDLDVKVLHVVRDPRATAYSYQCAKRYIEPMGPARSTSYWAAFNVASELVGAAVPERYLRVRYEDLSRRPREVVAEVMRFVGLDGEPPVTPAGTYTMGVNHTVTGNPDRLGRGETRIRPDDRWRTGLGSRHAAVATGFALPLLGRYRYPLVAA